MSKPGAKWRGSVPADSEKQVNGNALLDLEVAIGEVFNRLAGDPCHCRADAHHLLDRVSREIGPAGEETPLVLMLHEHAHRQPELVARRVDAAEHGEHHHVIQLLIAERVLVLVGLQQLGDEVLARWPRSALLDHAVGIVEQGGGRVVDFRHVLLEGDAKREPHVGGNVGQPPPLALIEAKQKAGDPRRIGLGEFRHEVAASACGEGADDVADELGEARLQRDDELRRKGRIGEPPQPRMVIADTVQHYA